MSCASLFSCCDMICILVKRVSKNFAKTESCNKKRGWIVIYASNVSSRSSRDSDSCKVSCCLSGKHFRNGKYFQINLILKTALNLKMRHHCVVLGFMFSVVITQEDSDNWPCEHQIFCKPGEGGILHTVQMAGLFKVW